MLEIDHTQEHQTKETSTQVSRRFPSVKKDTGLVFIFEWNR
jgi:hypothetical protein